MKIGVPCSDFIPLQLRKTPIPSSLESQTSKMTTSGWMREIFISASGNNYPRLGQDLGTYTRYTETTADAGLGAYWGNEGNQTWAEAYDALVDQIKASTDAAERAALCAEAEKILMATGAVAPLHYYVNPYMVKPNVENLFVLPTGDVVWNYAEIK